MLPYERDSTLLVCWLTYYLVKIWPTYVYTDVMDQCTISKLHLFGIMRVILPPSHIFIHKVVHIMAV